MNPASDIAAMRPNVLLVGGALHGARMRIERLPMAMVLASPTKRKSRDARDCYVHQYEFIEEDHALNRHMVSVYAPAELPHPDVLRLAKSAAGKKPSSHRLTLG